MARIRVLGVIAHLDKGGGQAVQALQVVRALRRSVDVTLIGLSAAGAGRGTMQEGELEVVGDLRFPRGWFVLRQEVSRRRPDFDVVQAFDTYYSLPAARLAGADPLVVRLGAHPIEDLASRYGTPARVALGFLNPWLYHGTEVVVNARHLAAAFPGRAVTVIPNGVDVHRFDSPPPVSSVRASIGVPGDVPLVAFTGKIIPRKNVEDLYWLLDQLPDHHLLLIGTDQEPYYGDRYHRSVRAAFPQTLSRVHAVGEVRMARIPALLAAADLFVFPSRLEGMPNALLEAMASGLPVAAVDTAAHREIVPLPEEQLYADRDDLRRLAERWAGDSAAARARGRENRAWVSERFSLDTAAESYRRLYETILARRGSRR